MMQTSPPAKSFSPAVAPNPPSRHPFDRDVALRRLGCMVDLTHGSLGDYSTVHNLYTSSIKNGNRAQTIKWMKQVAVRFRTSAEARDSGIQIFDKFLSIAVAEDAKALLDIHLISYSAAVSVVIGSKIHDGNKCVTLASFKDFRIDALKYYECLILNKIRFAVTPQITPQAFSQELILLWRPDADQRAHLNLQESLISKFWEEPSSLLYAPSTIAISALILSFSILHVDCSDLLGSIPNFFFHAPKSSDKRFYDIDSCLIHFRGLNAIFPPRVLGTCDPSRTSPVSIATAQSPGSPTAQDLFQPISICGNKRRRNADVFDKMAYADDDSDAPPLKPRNLKL